MFDRFGGIITSLCSNSSIFFSEGSRKLARALIVEQIPKDRTPHRSQVHQRLDEVATKGASVVVEGGQLRRELHLRPLLVVGESVVVLFPAVVAAKLLLNRNGGLLLIRLTIG